MMDLSCFIHTSYMEHHDHLDWITWFPFSLCMKLGKTTPLFWWLHLAALYCCESRVLWICLWKFSPGNVNTKVRTGQWVGDGSHIPTATSFLTHFLTELTVHPTWQILCKKCVKSVATSEASIDFTILCLDRLDSEDGNMINGHATGTDLLEVPTIYKAYFLGLCKGISPENMALYGIVPPF